MHEEESEAEYVLDCIVATSQSAALLSMCLAWMFLPGFTRPA